MDNLDVIGYLDSNFFGCVDSCKSTFDYIFMMASGAISWRSVKQTLTATFMMEAGFAFCFELDFDLFCTLDINKLS